MKAFFKKLFIIVLLISMGGIWIFSYGPVLNGFAGYLGLIFAGLFVVLLLLYALYCSVRKAIAKRKTRKEYGIWYEKTHPKAGKNDTLVTCDVCGYRADFNVKCPICGSRKKSH